MNASSMATARTRRQGGFTLTEVIVAATLFTMGVVGIYALTGTLVRMTSLANQVSTATTLAEDKIEDLHAQPYASVSNGTDQVDDYVRIWNVTTNVASSYKGVTVIVRWYNMKGSPRQMTLRSMIDGATP